MAPQAAGGFQLRIVISVFDEIARIPAMLREVIQYGRSRPERIRPTQAVPGFILDETAANQAGWL
jgi:hypothetical protein